MRKLLLCIAGFVCLCNSLYASMNSGVQGMLGLCRDTGAGANAILGMLEARGSMYHGVDDINCDGVDDINCDGEIEACLLEMIKQGYDRESIERFLEMSDRCHDTDLSGTKEEYLHEIIKRGYDTGARADSVADMLGRCNLMYDDEVDINY